jgi:hypothetical protein
MWSSDAGELNAWASQYGKPLDPCDYCRPFANAKAGLVGASIQAVVNVLNVDNSPPVVEQLKVRNAQAARFRKVAVDEVLVPPRVQRLHQKASFENSRSFAVFAAAPADT